MIAQFGRGIGIAFYARMRIDDTRLALLSDILQLGPARPTLAQWLRMLAARLLSR